MRLRNQDQMAHSKKTCNSHSNEYNSSHGTQQLIATAPRCTGAKGERNGIRPLRHRAHHQDRAEAHVTPAQFACCTTNASGKGSESARLVLVEGVPVAEAAERCGITVQSVRNAMVRIRKRHKQLLAAFRCQRLDPCMPPCSLTNQARRRGVQKKGQQNDY